MELIDKDALVAEIEKRIFNLEQLGDRQFIATHFPEQFRFIEVYEGIIVFINTLEVKEVNLEKEIQVFSKMELELIKIYDANVGLTITMHQLCQCAKHFFELGLNTHK